MDITKKGINFLNTRRKDTNLNSYHRHSDRKEEVPKGYHLIGSVLKG